MTTVTETAQRWIEDAATEALEAKLAEYEITEYGSPRDVEYKAALLAAIRKELSKRSLAK